MTRPQPARSARLDPDRASPAPAAALADDLTPRFELGPTLGQGAFGSVVRARERSTGREVALKLLHRDGSVSAVERFLREAAVAAGLDHPGIVKVHAVGVHGGRPCIVYELIDGAPLDQAARTLDHRRRVELVRDAARAVGHAHAAGVVHRDLKPDNILVDAAGRVRVADFGLATVDGAERITQTGAALGTPTHMAPEQFQGRTSERPGPAVDVWSLGVVLYELLTGRLPFDAPTLIALAAEIDAARPPSPGAVDPAVPPAVEAVVLRALSRDPARRYGDAAALADALDAALTDAPARGGRRPLRRGAALVAGASTIVAALALALGPSPEPASPAPVDAVVVDDAPRGSPAGDRAPPGARAPASARPLTRRQLDGRGLRWGAWVDATTVLSGGPHDDLLLHDARTGELRRRWPARAASAVALEGGRVLLVSGDGAVLRLDAASAAPPARVASGLEGRVAVAAAGARVVVVDRRAARVLDEAGGQVAALVVPGDPACVALSPDGQVLAVGIEPPASTPGAAAAGLVLVWDLRRPAASPREVLAPGVAELLRFTPDGARLLAATSGRQLAELDLARATTTRVWNKAEGGHDGLTRVAHDGAITGLVVSPDGARAYSCARAAQEGLTAVRVWDLRRGGEAGPGLELPGRPLSLELSPDGEGLLLGLIGGVLVVPLEQVKPGERRARRHGELLQDATGVRWAVALAGSRVLTGGREAEVRLWDARTGEEVRAWPELRGARAAARSGAAAVVVLSERVCRLEPDTGHVRTLLRPVRPVGDEPDLTCAAAASVALLRASDGAWGVVFHTSTGEAISELAAGLWSAATLAPRGDRVLACEVTGATSADRVGALVLFRTGARTLSSPELRLPIAGVARQLCFDPLGRRFYVGTTLRHVASASMDQLELGRFAVGDAPVSHTSRILALAATPDGRTLLSAARLEPDGARSGSEVQAWDGETKAPLRAPDHLEGEVRTLDVAPDGRSYVVSTTGGVVHVRPLRR